MPRGICVRRYTAYPFPFLPTPLTCFVGELLRSGYMMICSSSYSGGHSCGETKTAGPQFAVVGYQIGPEAIPGSFLQTAEDVGSCPTRTPVQRGRYCSSPSTTLSLRNGWVWTFLCGLRIMFFFPSKMVYFLAILFMLKTMDVLVTVGWVPRRIRIWE